MVLPIGTIVTMSLGAENSINVWIQASASDRTTTDPVVMGKSPINYNLNFRGTVQLLSFLIFLYLEARRFTPLV